MLFGQYSASAAGGPAAVHDCRHRDSRAPNWRADNACEDVHARGGYALSPWRHWCRESWQFRRIYGLPPPELATFEPPDEAERARGGARRVPLNRRRRAAQE